MAPLAKLAAVVTATGLVGAVSYLGWQYFKLRRQLRLHHQHYQLQQHQQQQAAVVAEEEQELEIEYESEMSRRREFVKQMAREAWDAYRLNAWGQDTLIACSRDGNTFFNFWFGKDSGRSLVTAMSTLHVMGMDDEFARAKRWVENKFDLAKCKEQWDVRHTVNEYVGSMLSCYSLTDEKVFLEKAVEIAKALGPAYKMSTSGIPFRYVNPKTGQVKEVGSTRLSDSCAGFLEYPILTDMSGDIEFANRIDRVRKVLSARRHSNQGLFMKHLNIETGDWSATKLGGTSSLFEAQRDFYHSLVKSYIQTDGLDEAALELYKSAMDAVEANRLFGTSTSGLIFPRDLDYPSNVHDDHSEYAGCYLGAMLSLGACAQQRQLLEQMQNVKRMTPICDFRKQEETERIVSHWKLAEQLAETFHEASTRSRTGLPPWRFYFDHNDEATNWSENYKGYYLGPELAETYFILYRLTHKEKYRDYAWQLVESIYKHCRTEKGAYGEIESVNGIPTVKMCNFQPAHFIGATLKYLYLIFCDDSVLPLDKWVFNAAGQPLPIRGNYQVSWNWKEVCTIG